MEDTEPTWEGYCYRRDRVVKYCNPSTYVWDWESNFFDNLEAVIANSCGFSDKQRTRKKYGGCSISRYKMTQFGEILVKEHEKRINVITPIAEWPIIQYKEASHAKPPIILHPSIFSNPLPVHKP